MGLPFAVIASTTLQRGILMSALVSAAALVGFLIARLLGPRASDLWRVIAASFAAVCAITAIVRSGRISAVLLDGLGVYVPLAAANVILISVAAPIVRRPFFAALREVVFSCVGFTFAMGVLSVIREVLSLHTVWGRPVSFGAVPIGGAALPCFGFILLGFFAAFGRTLGRVRLRMLLRQAMDAAQEEREEGV